MPMPSHIHPTAIIADGAIIGENVTIGANCYIGANVQIGDNSVLHQSVVIDGHTQIGTGNQIFPFAVLGMAPQHFRYAGEPSTLVIGDNNQIREHVSMHPGTAVDNMTTCVGSHGMFMAGSHIAHDCVIGDHVVMANGVQVGGHVHIGDRCYIGALVGVHPFVRVGRNVIIGGLSKVEQDVIPFSRINGNPCFLDGINVIGLERNGFDRESIRHIRAAFKDIFKAEGGFDERVALAMKTHAGNQNVKDILDFITANEKRPIMQVKRHGQS
jgi:UDP-N-acetylglucosamine acyltransferase